MKPILDLTPLLLAKLRPLEPMIDPRVVEAVRAHIVRCTSAARQFVRIMLARVCQYVHIIQSTQRKRYLSRIPTFVPISFQHGTNMRVIKFILTAWWLKYAYIDLDGCLLKRFRITRRPSEMEIRHFGSYINWALDEWTRTLRPTPIVIRRLVLLYILKALGVRLFVWTNRPPQHERITHLALGKHVWLFDAFYHCAGAKDEMVLYGPVMDDQEKYLRCGIGWSLLVEQV